MASDLAAPKITKILADFPAKTRIILCAASAVAGLHKSLGVRTFPFSTFQCTVFNGKDKNRDVFSPPRSLHTTMIRTTSLP